MAKSMKFVTACNKFFGRLDGQSLSDFAAELKHLTDADKAEMAPQLAEALGVDEVTV